MSINDWKHPDINKYPENQLYINQYDTKVTAIILGKADLTVKLAFLFSNYHNESIQELLQISLKVLFGETFTKFCFQLMVYMFMLTWSDFHSENLTYLQGR